MFLIVNDREVIYRREAAVVLGSNAAGEFLLNPKPAEAVCALAPGLAGLELSLRGATPVLLNRQRVAAHSSPHVLNGDVLEFGAHTIAVRLPEPESRIARAMWQRVFEIESELHHEVLNRLRLSNLPTPDDQYRKQIEHELERQLSEAELGPELEGFLAQQALRELLVDRVQGYGQSGRQESRAALAQTFAPQLAQLAAAIGLSDKEDQRSNAERIEVLLPWALQARKGQLSAQSKRQLALGLIREQLHDLIFGLGPLEDLLRAPDISEIMVLPSCDIYLERRGHLQHSGRRMPSVTVSRRIIERIVARAGRRVDQTSPMVDVRLADGSRCNVVIEPVAFKGPTVTIRRFPARRLTVEDLLDRKTISLPVANFLRAAVAAKKNIIVAGGTGSGKTTLLNVLCGWLAPDERILTAEDTAELDLPQEHCVSLQARPANLEGQHAVTIRDLVRNTLRMRPDRIIVGECRGGETLDMLQAMNTGHEGSLTTIHANSPWDALRRLEVLALEADGIALPVRAVREQIASAVDLLVQVQRFRDGARRITSVCEVVEFDEHEGVIILEEIYQLRLNRKKIKLAPVELEFTGYVPTFLDDLLATGVVTLEALF